MDIQLKRGLLDACVLAAIKNEDSYGYKIIKDLKPCIELSESTLYTILKRLEMASMLTVRSVEHDGRLRKYYHITSLGLKRIDEFKKEWKEIYRPTDDVVIVHIPPKGSFDRESIVKSYDRARQIFKTWYYLHCYISCRYAVHFFDELFDFNI